MTTFTFFEDKDAIKREGMLAILNSLPYHFRGKEEALEVLRQKQSPCNVLHQNLVELEHEMERKETNYRNMVSALELANQELAACHRTIKASNLQGLKDALAEQTRRAEIAEKAADELRAALAQECSLHEADVLSRDQSITEHQQALVSQQSRIDAIVDKDTCA